MNVLFLCTGNSCRSQIAEAYGRRFQKAGHRVWSAGTSPHGINPRTVEVLEEAGLSLESHHSKDVEEVPVDSLDLVITLCGHADENIPQSLESIPREHWDLEDPAAATGDDGAVLEVFRESRADIERRVSALFAG